MVKHLKKKSLSGEFGGWGGWGYCLDVLPNSLNIEEPGTEMVNIQVKYPTVEYFCFISKDKVQIE